MVLPFRLKFTRGPLPAMPPPESLCVDDVVGIVGAYHPGAQGPRKPALWEMDGDDRDQVEL